MAMQSYGYNNKYNNNYGGSSGYGGWAPQKQEHYGTYGSSSSSSYSKVQVQAQAQAQAQMSVFGQDPFCEIAPSAFPPGTDAKVVECFNRMDRDGNGAVDDRELQAVLSASCGHTFGLRTVHLLMYAFTHTNKRIIGPKEFIPLLNCLQSWRGIFQRHDRDRNGSIDSQELCQALASLGFRVSNQILNLLISKFNNSGRTFSLQYDNFIECCLTVKGLSETFKEKEDMYGRATFGYEEFLLNVMPFIIA